MTLEDAVRELLRCLSDDGECVVPWEQVRRWPKGAVDTFQLTGWLRASDLAETVECPGCEESRSMPVEIVPGDDGEVVRAFVTCEDRNFGRVKIPPVRLQQWRFGLDQLARWIAGTLALRFSGKRFDGGRLLELGLVSGDKRAQMLCLHAAGGMALVADSNRIPLVDAIQCVDEALTLDSDLIRQLVDSSTTGDDRYTASTTRREQRKLETAAMHEEWRKEYRVLKKRRPSLSGVWYSQQIAKMECAHERRAGTIKKNMK